MSKRKRRREAGEQARDPAMAEADTEDGAPDLAPEEVRRPPLPLPFPPIMDGTLGFSLRPWGTWPDDAHALVAAWADPEVARWTKVPPAPDLETAQSWIGGEEARREGGIALDLVVASLEDPNQVLGEVGFVLAEPQRLWAEVGYWLTPSARGRGLAVPVVRAFTEFVLADLPVRTIFARTHPGNPVSAAVAQGAGYTSAGTLDDGTQVWAKDAAVT